uniref:Gamma-glutamylcyclotransferase family protein n=1 Tax=Bursaphelenchus xylophilus TaxID=6326 RepID=A0A1I7SHG9_BURXY
MLVEGELYTVDDAKLLELDELENHPHFYVRHRETFDLLTDKNNDVVSGQTTAWVYQLPTWTEALLAEGTEPLKCYSSKGSHGREYVE